MFLAFKLTDIITVPFGWILNFLYSITGNYGVALILFAFVVYMVLLPITAKSKKSMMAMSRLTPRVKDIQERYSDDPNKQNQMIQQLYQEEGVSMTGGCLWSLVPLLILIPLFTIIRQPIVYILGETSENAQLIVEAIKAADPTVFGGNNYYDQVSAAQAIPQFVEQVKAAVPGISELALEGIRFDFLGINLGSIPQFNVFKWAVWDWAHIGLFLIPLLSAATQVVQLWLNQKVNKSLVTDENGVQDEETAESSQAAQTNKSMMLMGPLMSLWIGFTVPAGLSVYWLVGGVVRTVQDILLTKHYRKIYDEEDAVRLRNAIARDEAEAEKERIRAERRAANPDGITANTSKKKLQKAEKEREAAERAAAAREYNAKRGVAEETAAEENDVLSGIPERPYCKGRAYVANRYGRKED